MREFGFLKALLSGRGALLELFFAAVLLALGVNLLASGIAAFFDVTSGRLILTSSALIVISFGLIARKLLEQRCVQRRFSGLFVYNKQRNELVRIPAYEFSEAVSGYLDSLFSENEAIRKLWEKEPLSGIFDYNKESKKVTLRQLASLALIREATEYFLLDRLSTHLTDYFNEPPFDNNLLKQFEREDVPTVLFRNRFLDVFSRPMIERPAFIDSAWPREPSPGKVVRMFGPNSVRYESFELVLPREAKVSRGTEGKIEIDTAKFTLHIEADFKGANTNLPRSFERLYLNENSMHDTHAYLVEVEISVVFKALALLHRSGWHYYMWLDSFLNALDRRFSSSAFFERIDWDSAMTIVRVMQHTSDLNSRRETGSAQEVFQGPTGSETPEKKGEISAQQGHEA